MKDEWSFEDKVDWGWSKDIVERKYGPIDRGYRTDKEALNKIFEEMMKEPYFEKTLSNPKAKKKVILHSPDF